MSLQQGPQNNNTNSSSSNEKLPERQCQYGLLKRISDQLRIRTDINPQQASIVLWRKQEPASTNMPTSENNLPRHLLKCASLPNFTVTNKASSLLHSTDESSGDGDETHCFKSDAESTDTPMNGKNVELPNLQSPRLDKTASNETHYTDITQESHLEKSPSTKRSLEDTLEDTFSSEDQPRFRDYTMDAKRPRICPSSNTESDENTSLMNNTVD